MKITKKILERIIQEEVSRLLEVEGAKYPNTREKHRKKGAVVDFFRHDGLDQAKWPSAFKDLTVDGDESGAKPDAFTITLKPASRPTPEGLRKLRQYVEINKFFEFVKRLFKENSRMRHPAGLKQKMYDRFDAFVLESSDLKDTGEWDFHFKWSKRVALAQRDGLGQTLYQNKLAHSLSDLSRERRRADRLGIDKWTSKAKAIKPANPPTDLDK